MKGQANLKPLLSEFIAVVEDDTQLEDRDTKLRQLADRAKRLLRTEPHTRLPTNR